MRSDPSLGFKKRFEGELGDFGDASPGNSFSGHERDHLFVSSGGEQFHDVGGISGLDHPGDGRTFSLLDYDRDGWSDMVVASANAPTVQLYRNRIGDRQTAGVVALRLEGGNRSASASGKWSCRDGIGAIVKAELPDGRILMREHRCGDGRSALNSATMMLGLGAAEGLKSLTVRWPSGRETSVADIDAGTLLTVYEDPSASGNGKSSSRDTYVLDVIDQGGAPGERTPKQLAFDAPSTGTLNSWTAMATWCVACKKAQPNVALLREAFGEGDLQLFGIPADLEESKELLDTYVRDQSPEYQVLTDLPLGQRTAFKQHLKDTLEEEGLPCTVITDASGKVLLTTYGVPSVSDVRRLLAAQSGQ